MNSLSTAKKMIGVLGIVVGLLIMFVFPAPAGLPEESMLGAGLIVWALVWVAGGIIKEYVTMLAMGCALLIAYRGTFGFEDIFAQFSKTNAWLVVWGMILGICFAKTGLLKRMAARILTWFPNSLLGTMVGVTVAGMVVSPMIPAGVARTAVAGPMVREMAHQMGYKDGSKGAIALWSSLYTGWDLTIHTFVSASFNGYLVVAALPEPFNAEITWIKWLAYSLPWTIITFVLLTGFMYRKYNPNDGKKVDKAFLKQELAAMGPMSAKEKLTAVIVILCLIAWVTEQIHGIPACVTGMIGCTILLAAGVIDLPSLRNGINIDFLIYLGLIIQLGTWLSTLGISSWLVNIFTPIVSSVTAMPVLLCVALFLITCLVRFAVTSWVAAISLFGALVCPICVAAGIHPFAGMFAVYCGVGVFITAYCNISYVACLGVTGEMTDEAKNRPYAIAYVVCSVIGIAASVLIWSISGLLYI